MNKKIYLDVSARLHSLYGQLILAPPDGYQVIRADTDLDRVAGKLVSTGKFDFLRRAITEMVPANLFKAYLEVTKRPPAEASLTYSTGHLVFRNEPWVVDVESVTQLGGGKLRLLKAYHAVIQKTLSSRNCKAIMCWTETERKTFLENLDCRGFEEKLHTVQLAVNKKSFAPRKHESDNSDNRVRLLFVSSSNLRGEFDLKGGKELLEAFVQLKKKYCNLELLIRCDVPDKVREDYKEVEGLRIIEEIIPWAQLEQEFLAADIFMLPAHHTPAMVFLDAMSYELPVITTDVRANWEMVDNGRTGFTVKKSEAVPYYIGVEPQWGTHRFDKAIKVIDTKVVQELIEKTSILIENAELRRQMGKAGRQEVETGKFSIGTRNEKLKKIFDAATTQ